MEIGGRKIGINADPFVVAELSGNHDGSLDRALAIVDAVADAGAHALKLQTYTAETMTLDLKPRGLTIDDPASPWSGANLYELYEKAHTPWEWHAPIFDRARVRGLLPFSAPFDVTAVDFLEGLDPACHKIASFEIVDLPLIRYAAATGRPLIISTGMATLAEIDAAVRTARAAGCRELVLLKCTSAYPASPTESNLRTIPHLRAIFGCEVGVSDHTLGTGVAVASVALGAVVIEKHVTLDRERATVDSSFSLVPDELRSLVEETRQARQALGAVVFGPSTTETPSLALRRSLLITGDLEEGDVLTPENVRSLRPALGLPPGELGRVLGLRLTSSVERGTPVTWDLFK